MRNEVCRRIQGVFERQLRNLRKFMKVGEEPVEKKGLEKKLSTKLGSNLSIIMAGMKKKGS